MTSILGRTFIFIYTVFDIQKSICKSLEKVIFWRFFLQIFFPRKTLKFPDKNCHLLTRRRLRNTLWLKIIIELLVFLYSVCLASLCLFNHSFRHCVKSVQIQSYFRSVFSCFWTEYGDLRSKSPYSVQIKENTDHK